MPVYLPFFGPHPQCPSIYPSLDLIHHVRLPKPLWTSPNIPSTYHSLDLTTIPVYLPLSRPRFHVRLPTLLWTSPTMPVYPLLLGITPCPSTYPSLDLALHAQLPILSRLHPPCPSTYPSLDLPHHARLHIPLSRPRSHARLPTPLWTSPTMPVHEPLWPDLP